MTDAETPDPEHLAPDELRIEREGRGSYLVRNGRGGRMRVAYEGSADSFTPIELLRLATGLCAALSADHVLASRLGEGFAATVETDARVEAAGSPTERRIAELSTRIVAEAGGLDPERRAPLVERAEAAVDRLCAVGRTVEQGAAVRTEVVVEPRAASRD